ncbi:MAG: TolC family protein [Bacillota bacterium]
MRFKALLGLFVAAVLLGMVPTAWAAGDQKQSGAQAEQLTLAKAVQRALNHSNALKKAELDVDKADDALVPASGLWYVNYSPEAEAGILAAESTHFAWQAALKTYDAQRDSVIMGVYDKYYDVLVALRDVKAKELALAKAERELGTVKALMSVGMAGKLAVDGAEAAVTGARAALASSQAALDNAYAALNQLVGFAEDYRPVLADLPAYSPVTTDLNTYILRALDDSPTVWTAVEAARFKESIKNFAAPQGSGLQTVTDEDAEKADLDAKTAKDATRLLVRSLYHGVKGLEEAYAAAEQGVKIAAENLRITQLKYELGMATKKDVAAAEADLAAAEQKLFDLTAQHAYMKLALEKPWAYLSVMSSSATSSSGP